MLGARSENSVTGSQDVTQIGHNSGTVSIGLTFEQHEANVRERLAEMRADLERAHGAERALLQAQIDAGNATLLNLQQDYERNVAELTDLRQTLAQYHNRIDTGRHAAADAALERGDMSLARALLGELAAQVRAKREDFSKEEALLEFKLGEIAEAEICWADAATHYARAAQLDPTLEALHKATDFTQLAGDYARAERLAQDYVTFARAGDDPKDLSHALASNATVLYRLGRYAEAEIHFAQALDLVRMTVGDVHLDFSSSLINLALVVQDQGRYDEAEKLCREALEIDLVIFGEVHPDYATGLNNLAMVVEAQGRYTESEKFYVEALKIDRATIGEGHPAYAIHLNNLAWVLVKLDRSEEARPLFEQALAIFRATLPPDHPHIQNVQGHLPKLP
jgi:tetratricopeptide (TPR) repeat protein